MKTNARPSIIAQAVKNVSTEKYAGNVVFRKEPEKLTKNTFRFTLKVRDKNKAGAMIDAVTGRKQPKVDQTVYIDVMQEIFKLDPRETIYGDHSVLGRLINDNPSDTAITPEKKETAKTDIVQKKSKKEKLSTETGIQSNNVLSALQFLLDNPNAIAELQKMQSSNKKQKQNSH